MSRGGFRARYRGYGLWMNGGFVCVCISFFFCLVNFLGLSVCGIKNWWNEIGQSEERFFFSHSNLDFWCLQQFLVN